MQLVVNRLLQMISNVALRHGAAFGQGNARSPSSGGEFVQSKVDHPHLGAISVTNNDVVPGLNEVNNGASSFFD